MLEEQDPYALAGRLFLVASMYFLFRSLSRWPAISHMIWLPSVIAHEVSHLFVGLLLGAKPVDFSIMPKRTQGADQYELGHVSFRGLRWWQMLPVATAPLFLLAPLGAMIVLESLAQQRSQAEVMMSAYAALQCFAGAWPSPQDLAQARRTIYVLIGLGAIALALYWAFMVRAA